MAGRSNSLAATAAASSAPLPSVGAGAAVPALGSAAGISPCGVVVSGACDTREDTVWQPWCKRTLLLRRRRRVWAAGGEGVLACVTNVALRRTVLCEQDDVPHSQCGGQWR